MVDIYAIQPNGLFCCFSTITDCPTYWNLTIDEAMEVVRSQVPDKSVENFIGELKPFSEIEDRTLIRVISLEEYNQFFIEVHDKQALKIYYQNSKEVQP